MELLSKKGRRITSLLLVLLMIITTAVSSAGGIFAAEKRISMITESITPQTTEIQVNISSLPASGILRVVQMDSSTDYVSANLNNYTSLNFSLLTNLKEGANTLALSAKPAEGHKIYVVMRDSSGSETKDYIDGPFTVASQNSSDADEKYTVNDILKGCSVTLNGIENGKIRNDASELSATVKLHSSVESCYLIVSAYPGNAAFDPDNTVTKRLYSAEKWNPFEDALKSADSVLRQGEPEPSLQEYRNAIAALNSAYNNLTNSGSGSSSKGGSYSGGSTVSKPSDENKNNENPAPDIESPENDTNAAELFSDVDDTSWFKEAVDYVIKNGIFKGTSSTTFSPDSIMTRAMAMKMLANIAGADTEGGNTWYEKAVEWSINEGISDGSDAESEITREQLVTLLYRFSKASSADADLSPFSDSSEISDYAEDAFKWAYKNGIIRGMGDGTLNPKGKATRAQVASMIKNYHEMIKKTAY